MKFTIMGFNQEKLKELDLDLTDSLILRWFVDFKDSGYMTTEIFENDKYYWIKYEYLLQEIPIININNKKTLGRRLKTLSEKGVLKQFIKRKGGIFTLYTLGEKYKLLISNNLVTQKSQGYTLESHKGSDSKVTTKDSSIKEINLLKDSNTKHNKTKNIKLYEQLEELQIDNDLKEKIIEFIDFRKEINKPITIRSIKTSIEQIGKKFDSKQHLIESIDNSIMNGWQGLFPMKTNKNNYKEKNFKTKEEINKESVEKYGF